MNSTAKKAKGWQLNSENDICKKNERVGSEKVNAKNQKYRTKYITSSTLSP